ncbi:hypothetical protein AB0M39_08880 [Streptomyces sp. NPDC051907]|uniref:hypothetical protein n=1 Tax=Streptomyces sp. NPDC051907 TaxID=3155284 RepID=UPI0034491B90
MHDNEETDSSLRAHLEVTMRYRLDVVKNSGGDEDDGKGGNPPTGDGDDGRDYSS